MPDCWHAQINRVRAEYDTVTEDLQRELSAGAAQMSLFDMPQRINLDSPAQIKDALARLGIEVETTREWRMQKLAREHPIIQRLLDYRGLSKSLGSYGEGMLDHINPTTGRIHANFHQIGTPTGRISCSNPSLQQVPHAIEYRSCFRAPQGRKLVIVTIPRSRCASSPTSRVMKRCLQPSLPALISTALPRRRCSASRSIKSRRSSAHMPRV